MPPGGTGGGWGREQDPQTLHAAAWSLQRCNQDRRNRPNFFQALRAPRSRAFSLGNRRRIPCGAALPASRSFSNSDANSSSPTSDRVSASRSAAALRLGSAACCAPDEPCVQGQVLCSLSMAVILLIKPQGAIGQHQGAVVSLGHSFSLRKRNATSAAIHRVLRRITRLRSKRCISPALLADRAGGPYRQPRVHPVFHGMRKPHAPIN